eukprot:SAG31_NODE_3115_length_4659_cov_2.837939_2_plen_78_part_00
MHERVEAELAAEQRRARQAIEIAALDAERAERATTVRNSWSGWVNRKLISMLWSMVITGGVSMHAGILCTNLGTATG